MSSAITCRACRARLKLPAGSTKTKVRCPKCSTRMDLAAALSASVYLPTAQPGVPAAPPAPGREEDPLPYSDLAPPVSRPTPPPLPPTKSPATEAPLSLDDDTPPEPAPAARAVPLPFRTLARVTADTAKQFAGPCEVVFVPHGVFLESVPFRPFLYAPIGSQVARPVRKTVVLQLPDGRGVTVEFLGRDANQIANDAAGFLSADRPVPVASEYRHSPVWLLGVALIFSLGLAIAPIVMAQRVGLDFPTGVVIGAGFAVAGLLVNAIVALFTRLPVPAKVAVMAVNSAAVTGVFFLAAMAFLAGLKHAEPPGPQPPGGPTEPPPKPPGAPGTPGSPPPVDPVRAGLPTAVDAAYRDGVYRFDDGPDDVTALGFSAESGALVVGYKNGMTRVWRLDQPTIEPHSTGPRCDGAASRIAFDHTGAIAYMACPGGTVAALWNDPPAAPVKIPGEQLVAFPHPNGERFATLRANAITLRYVPTTLIKKPDNKAKGFQLTTAKDETLPADVKAQFAAPQRPTFLAWHPTGKLLSGQVDGTVATWGAAGPTSTVASRDHKAAVRAWAASPSTWDFATGDDKGVVGIWANKAMAPKTFTAATGGVTQLAFSPSGTLLAVGDAAGSVRVWDLSANRAIARLVRVGTHVAFGPNDDTVLFSDGKAVELWSLGELAKQP